VESAVGDRVDVAVVGAGFGGLAVACVCADAGFSVTILERRPQLAPEGVGLLIQPNGLAVLERLGVLEQVLVVGRRITTVRQCDPSGRVRAVASYGELRHPHPYLLAVERTRLISLLAGRLPAAVTLRTGCTVAGLERQDGRVCGVRYGDGSGLHTLRAACVVGADGINSVVRQALNVRIRSRTGPDRYLIGLAPCEPGDDAAVLYCGQGWCDGVLPYRQGTYFFDHINGENRDAVQRRDFDAWRDTYVQRVPEAARIVAYLGSFDDLSFLPGRTHRAVPRVLPGAALVGDAAAAVHPHSGQGANLALEDALALGAALAAHGPRQTAALDAYARARDAKLRRYVPWSIVIGRTMDGPNPGWRTMRRLGYLATHVGPARRAAVRQQAGLG